MDHKKVILIDGNASIHRSYHALPVMKDISGVQVNAVFGFAKMLNWLIEEESPSHICIAFDNPKPTFRHKRFKDYKAHRKETDEELKKQFSILFSLLNAYRISFIEKEGYEADDIIATLAEKFIDADASADILVITGDKDIYQILDKSKNIAISNGTKSSKKHTYSDCKEKFGVEAEQIVDYLGLIGDKSDNLPGIPGIGPVTARNLLTQYGSTEEIYKNLDNIKPNIAKKLEEGKESGMMTRDMVKLAHNIELDINIDSCAWHGPSFEDLGNQYSSLDFRSLMRNIPVKKPEASLRSYKILRDQDLLAKFLESLEPESVLAVEIVSLDEKYLALAIAKDLDSSVYLPFGHNYLGVKKQLDKNKVLRSLAASIESKKINITALNLKKVYKLLKPENISSESLFFDIILADYVLYNETGKDKLSQITAKWLDTPIPEYSDLNENSEEKSFAEFAAMRVSAVLELTDILKKDIQKSGRQSLLEDIEIKSVKTLAEMEITGIKIDVKELNSSEVQLNKRLKELEKSIYSLSGEEFNINSSKQTAYILFEVLKLTPKRKTKNGLSTGEDVLRKLMKEHPVIEKLLEYRKLKKLISTYIEPIPKQINMNTGRLHTTFHSNGTVTGRLSSANPNLQNIPVRSEEGKLIRKAFVADKDFSLLSADYSQIDLRVLAHISNDDNLVKSFKTGKDLHLRTAAAVYDIPEEDVSPDMRKHAKAVNFGIAYGMSYNALSERTGLSRKESKEFIEKYFLQYPGIKKYMNDIVDRAKKDMYVETILNRKRYLPDINAGHPKLRSLAERIAVNTPIQGSSADIIKKAMIELDEEFDFNNREVRLLLQIHDELLFEIPDRLVEKTVSVIKDIMENTIVLSVPLVVDIKKGKNWLEMTKC